MTLKQGIGWGALVVATVGIHSVVKGPLWKRAKDPGTPSAALVRAGQPAPDFSLPDLGGQTVSLSSFKDRKIVVIDFWATWCGPCRMAMPLLQEFYDAHRAKGVEVLSVNIGESKDKAGAFIKAQGFTFPVVLDESSSVAGQYGVRGIPMLVVIDRGGVVREVHTGFDPELASILAKSAASLASPKKP